MAVTHQVSPSVQTSGVMLMKCSGLTGRRDWMPNETVIFNARNKHVFFSYLCVQKIFYSNTIHSQSSFYADFECQGLHNDHKVLYTEKNDFVV